VVSGSGDIAPVVDPGAGSVANTQIGAFAGLIAVVIVATMFITAEYRRGLIRTTLAASRGRGQVLAAKALVIGLTGFVTGLIAAAGTVLIVTRMARVKGYELFPVPWPTELRLITGTAALVAAAAVLTLAVGTITRRSASAVVITIVAVVIPFFLAFTAAVPTAVGDWLLRVTPAAAFAIQQSTPRYHQVQALYSPSLGDMFFPLAPWAGLAVLCAWATLALAAAAYLLNRRDA
jgi:ABC-type transport system involved in multi-copper enzyme maturation permease subunit